MSTQVAFLGPNGTYAEEAAIYLAKLEKYNDAKFIPCAGIRSVIDHIARKLCDVAVVPIENSVEGGVTATLDSLWTNPELFIRRAVVMPIQHSLIGDIAIKEISEVLSHPQALAQCSGWLQQNLPKALQLPTNSTAEAVKMIRGSHFRAAIGPRIKTESNGLKEIAYPINDIAGNCTRFVLIEHDECEQEGDVSTIAFSLHSNSPGALLEALSCISNLGLNMSRIESRPSKRELGEYVFFIDVELSKSKKEITYKLLEDLSPLCENLVNFGVYPSTSIQTKST
mgnify:CR=1 FL=1